MKKTASTLSALERASVKAQQAAARYQALLARKTTEERKRHTRRLYILGDVLLREAETDERFASVVQKLIADFANPSDRALLDGWRRRHPSSDQDMPPRSGPTDKAGRT